MKVLWIDEFVCYPPTSGGLSRAYGLVKFLSRYVRIVYFAPSRRSTDDEGIEHLKSLGIAVSTVGRPVRRKITKAIFSRVKGLFEPYPAHWVLSWDNAIRSALADTITEHEPDIIFAERLCTCRWLDLDRIKVPFVLGEDNVETTLESQIAAAMGWSPEGLLRKWEVRKVRRYESYVASRAALSVVVSETDRDQLKEICPTAQIVVVPNGVDLEQFSEVGPTNSGIVVFTGTLSYLPNIEAVNIIVREIFPKVKALAPQARFRIVGRTPPESMLKSVQEGVEIIPNVPDIRPYIAEADVVIVPLMSGSGTRIKILEAMGMGKAIVSTSKGAEGLDVKDGYDIIIRDRVDEFAEAVVHLLSQPSLRTSLGHNARLTAEQKYSYNSLAIHLATVLSSIQD
jgi:glycosyltransferase involved in cell wall biosynthesis